MERRLASGMPWDAETSRLLDQTPSNPARSTSFAPRPLWAPTIRTRPGRVNSSLNFFALDIPLSHEGVIQEKEKGWSGPVSRILSSPRGEGWSFLWVPHCCRTLAAYPRAPGGPPFSPALQQGIALLFGLAPGGVCQASPSPGCWCALTAPFHPYPAGSPQQEREQGLPTWRYLFCGTFPGVAPGGRYPPPCPVESGLSSPVLRSERPPGPLQPGTNIAAFAPPGKEGIEKDARMPRVVPSTHLDPGRRITRPLNRS